MFLQGVLCRHFDQVEWNINLKKLNELDSKHI